MRRVGEGLLARTLPRVEWTHEAHLAATLWLMRERPDLNLEQALPGIIAGYNASVGGVNDDHRGYHHTITMTYLAAVRAFCAAQGRGLALVEAVNRLLRSPIGRRDYPLTLYSGERLMSVAARRGWLAPDLPAGEEPGE